MTSLPPKPVASQHLEKDEDEGRGQGDERSSRRLSQEDRVYVPSRSMRVGDSYVASYDRIRDDDRHASRYRDRDWDRRDRDARDRGPRGREDERDYYRRRDKDTYLARDDRRSRHPPSPRRSDRPYRSRSPRGRRPYSPPRHASRYPHSRSPPTKRPRYGSRSPPRSPRSPRRRRSRSHSRTPEHRRREREAARDRNDHPESKPATQSASISSPKKNASTVSRSQSPKHRIGEMATKLGSSSTNATEQKPSESPESIANKDSSSKETVGGNKQEKKLPRTQQPLAEPSKDEISRSPVAVAHTNQATELKARDRTPSPPRQPRYMSNQVTRDTGHGRWTSRSPPRAPRIFPRSSAQSASTSHNGRRQQILGAMSISESKKVEKTERPSATAQLNAEIARLESHRAGLAAEYAQLSKNARRALHELDMAMLDLRAAEGRRKVAAGQLEKARAGVLGIDATAIGSTVV